MLNILSFNLTDWYHSPDNRKNMSGHLWSHLPSRVENITDRLLLFLNERNLKATFFVVGRLAAQHPGLIRKIQASGHEIAAHSNWYHRASRLIPEDFEKDLVMCLSQLQDITGEPVTTYRDPGFSLDSSNNRIFQILANNGIIVDSSIKCKADDNKSPFIIKTGNTEILEFPLINSIFGFPYSGGTFFRLLPMSILSKLIKNSQYNMLYFDPRDFDAENPYTNIFSLYRNWLNNINTDVSMERLSEILSLTNTCSIGQAAENMIINKHAK